MSSQTLIDEVRVTRYYAARCTELGRESGAPVIVVLASGMGDGVFDVNQWNSQLRRGLVELCVLAALERDEAYGYQLVERLRATESLELTESTVYPVLTRLAGEQLLSVRTAPSPNGPPRRYYRLTESGRRRLAQMKQHWNSVSRSIERLLSGVE